MLASTVLAVSLALGLQAASVTPDPAAVEPATQLPAVETEAAEPEPPRVICRMETIVGSRMPSRICMTVEHRDQRRRDSRALVQRLDVQNSNRDRIYAPGARGGE